MPDVDVVTGAFGYTGRYITGRLLESGRSVKTLTGHPNRPNPFGDQIDVAPLDFEDRRNLTEHLRGATTLYNTYWVRFPTRGRHLRAGSCEQRDPRPSRERRRRAPDRAREHHQPVEGLAVRVLPGQGQGRRDDPRLGPRVLDRPSDRDLWTGRHPDQQHRLHPAEAPGLRDPGLGLVPAQAGLGRGRGGDLRAVRT